MAYLTSGEEFHYTVNVMKLEGIDNPTRFVREQFQKVFQKDHYKIYNDVFLENPNAFFRFDINSKDDFIKNVNNINHPLYKFVNIE